MNYIPIPDSGGLYPLPDGDLSTIATALNRTVGIRDDGKHPASPSERAALWVRFNQSIAELRGSTGGNDLSAIEASLGLAPKTSAPTNLIDTTRAKISARSYARQACAELLASGFQP